MFRTLFINEVRQHVLSYRFTILMLIVFVAFFVAAISFKPNPMSGEPPRPTQDAVGTEPLFVLAQRTFDYQLKPNRVSFAVSGRLKYLPNHFTYGSMSSREVSLGQRVHENIFFPTFLELDWVFIMSTLVAFIAIVLTFDAISGDKERGVLRLIVSYPVRRTQLFLAKYLASLVILFIPLFFAMISALLIVQWKDVGWGATEYTVISGVMLFSPIFLSFYILLGIFISSRVTRSEVSLLLLALCFTAFTVLIPGVSTALARQLKPLPSQLEIESKIKALYESAQGSIRSTETDLAVRRRMSNLLETHRQQQLEQAYLSTELALLSPNFIYTEACMDVAGQGLWRIERIIKQLKQHVHVLDNFILEKDRADPSSPHAGLVHYRTLSRKGVNLSEVPQFSESEPDIAERIYHAVPNIGILLFLNLSFVSLALLSLNKYDVR
jgi:ABC-type transport system involved in multi-copper enzyme maturation permease subunit